MNNKAKRMISVILLLGVVFLSGCNNKMITGQKKYKRISFASESLGEQTMYVNADTRVVNNSSEKMISQISIYEISEREISDQECNQMIENLGFTITPHEFEHNGNRIYINLVDYNERPNRGYFEMTEENLEKLAWEEFKKLPFMEGEYEYGGIKGEQSVENSEGKVVERVMVAFYPVLDGVRVIGDNRCYLWFDGSGLVEISIRMYSFKKTGTMDMVPLVDAEARIKTPDEFNLDEMARVDLLQVESVKLFLVNQFSRECEILQPMYTFYGTANIEGGKQADFRSSVIAIPETMTYEEE